MIINLLDFENNYVTPAKLQCADPSEEYSYSPLQNRTGLLTFAIFTRTEVLPLNSFAMLAIFIQRRGTFLLSGSRLEMFAECGTRYCQSGTHVLHHLTVTLETSNHNKKDLHEKENSVR